MNLAQHSLIFGLRVYQWTLSPVIAALAGPAGRCRFEPTCSRYAVEAVAVHGAVKGSALAAKRLCRCHPWGGEGIDPVPPLHHNPNLNPNPNSEIKIKSRIMIRREIADSAVGGRN